jgi:hypothetical protein
MQKMPEYKVYEIDGWDRFQQTFCAERKFAGID